MEDLPAFQKLKAKALPKGGSQNKSPEGKFWRGFTDSNVTQELGAVTHVNICEEAPHNFAATSSTRILVYDGKTRKRQRKFTRFGDKAYCGTFRKDGQLLVAGGEEGVIRVLDANSRTLLRKLEGHKTPVHVTKYSSDGLNILSGADDTTARWWDIASGKQVLRLDGNRDYVRAGAQSPSSESYWATGGYDHVCRLWDVRSGSCTMELDHGAPVEDIAFLPSGNLIATAGGPYICIWDILGSGQMLRKLKSHQKTVTSLTIARNVGPEETRGPRLLSASLDSTVKVFDLNTFKVSFMSRYPAPILSMDVSIKGDAMVVGMANGMLFSRFHSKERKKEVAHKEEEEMEMKRKFSPREEDLVVGKVAKKSTRKMTDYDIHLRKFRYKDAWDSVIERGDPTLVLGIVEEMSLTGALGIALSEREPEELIPALNFILKHIKNIRFSNGILSLLRVILDLYEGKVFWRGVLLERLNAIYSMVHKEINLAMELHEVHSALEMLLGAV